MHSFVRYAVIAVLCFKADLGWTQDKPASETRAPFEQGSHSANGFGVNAARVDSQITLQIPPGKAGAVYDYLNRSYIKSNELLKKAFPHLDLKGQDRVDVSEFTDYYFDTPSLALYNNQNSARLRKRVNTTDPNDRKSGRQLIQVKATPPGRFDMRTELKFKLVTKPNLRHPDTGYPLLGLVDTPLRQEFKEALAKVGVNPYQLRHVLTNHQTRSRIYIDWGKENVISFSVDEYEAGIWWAKASGCSVDVGRAEKPYTEADETKRKTIRDITEFMIGDLKAHFPGLEEATSEKYRILLDQLLAELPGLQFAIKYKLR